MRWPWQKKDESFREQAHDFYKKLQTARHDIDKWKKRFEEMERRWKWCRQQKEKWRAEKNRLLKLNSEQNPEVSDTTQADSSNVDGQTNEFPNIPLRIIEGL